MKTAFRVVAFLFFILFFQPLCAKKQLTNNPPQAGKYIVFTSNNLNSRLNLYYHDSVAHGHPVFINKNETKLQLNAPAFFFVSNAEQTPFLIYPGEKIVVNAAGNEGIRMQTEGDKVRNNELDFFRQLVHTTGNIYYAYTLMPYHKKANNINQIKDFEKKINEVKLSRFQFLTSYTRQSKVSPAFYKIAVNTIQSTALTDTLLLYHNNKELLKKQNLYQNTLSEKQASIKSIGYVPFQVYYRACTMLTSLLLGNPPDYLPANNAELQKRLSFVETKFGGITRDFLMAQALCSANNNNVSVTRAYIDRFYTLCGDMGYKNIVHRTFSQNAATVPGGNSLLSTDGKTVQEMQSVLLKYKGKIMLIDFWASWCGPCREEMPGLKSLQTKYGNKDIAFVSISTDRNTDDWLRAIGEESLINNNSFLLLNADRSGFIKQHKIHAIPRYLLIGKQGNIISENAPRPSDPKLQALIDKAL